MVDSTEEKTSWTEDSVTNDWNFFRKEMFTSNICEIFLIMEISRSITWLETGIRPDGTLDHHIHTFTS